MEQDVVAGLCQALGKTLGAEFSSEDISLLYRKVFHTSSSSGEALVAIKKIAGCDATLSCGGEKVLDVLVEMERERERKEMLFWDLQLLNTGRLHHMMDSLHVKTKHSISHRVHGYDLASSQQCSEETNSFQERDLCGKWTSTRKLKKRARNCWARLASEGLRSLLPPSCQTSHRENQTWGSVSLSDLLLLLEVKYDVVTQFLYTEMLQEHHTKRVWETLQPWQRDRELEELEDHAEEALMSLDMLQMAELPGALKIYRHPGITNQCWSAISFLKELHGFREKERRTLTELSQRLHKNSLRLVGLCIWLATLRAQRATNSFRALVSARQSWETWPNVNNPCKAEQGALLLHSSKEEDKEDRQQITDTLEQTPLQLLVLNQEQEMNQLVKLVHSVSQGDSREDESCEHDTLRSACEKSLKQIHAEQRGKMEDNTLLQQTHPSVYSHHQLNDCAPLLISHMIDLQEVKAAALLQTLADNDAKCVVALEDNYKTEIRTQSFTTLQDLLLSHPLNDRNPLENSYREQTAAGLCHTGLDATQSTSEESGEGQTDNCKLNEVKVVDGTQKKDVCSGCGAVIEDLPYLEIKYGSNEQSNEGQSQNEQQDATLNSNYDKQESLITLAWSKPPADHVTDEAQCATDLRTNIQSHPKTQIQLAQTDRGYHNDMNASISDGRCDMQTSNLEQLTTQDQPGQQDTCAECDLQKHAHVTESLRRIHPHLLADIPESNPYVDGLCFGESGEAVSICPEVDCCLPEMERERVREPVSAMERERTMRNLVDMQRRFEQRQQRGREKQLLRVQERLSIIQNKKAEKDLLGLKHTDRLKHLTQDLPMEDRNQQKTIVRERLEKLRRERSTIMQSKRDRNTTGFKQLLGPVVLHSSETEDEADWDTNV